MKALIHVDELFKWNLALTNTKNLLKDEKITEVAIVLNSEAVDVGIDPSKFDPILNEVDVYVCNNALNSRNINKDDLGEVFKVTPSGVVRIVELQEESFRYIKP